MPKLTPCLWFDDNAEEAVRYYTSIFKHSKVTGISRYGEVGREIHGRPAGSVMAIAFELDGTPFTALNGGPIFKFNESVSFQVECETQADVDYYWEKLAADGDKNAQQCGWLKDKFGLSWQIVPRRLPAMMADGKDPKAQRTFAAILQMQKPDIAALERAYAG